MGGERKILLDALPVVTVDLTSIQTRTPSGQEDQSDSDPQFRNVITYIFLPRNKR